LQPPQTPWQPLEEQQCLLMPERSEQSGAEKKPSEVEKKPSEVEKKPGAQHLRLQHLRLQHLRRQRTLERAAQWEVERKTGAPHLQPLHLQCLHLQRLQPQLEVGEGFGAQSPAVSR
jgi:hypothetical protein